MFFWRKKVWKWSLKNKKKAKILFFTKTMNLFFLNRWSSTLVKEKIKFKQLLKMIIFSTKTNSIQASVAEKTSQWRSKIKKVTKNILNSRTKIINILIENLLKWKSKCLKRINFKLNKSRRNVLSFHLVTRLKVFSLFLKQKMLRTRWNRTNLYLNFRMSASLSRISWMNLDISVSR